MIGPLISAGASLLGGLLNSNAQKDAQQTQMQIAQQNIALQKEFAQSGIQWKVQDANKAGIHPLYALGASTHNFAPVSVGAIPQTGIGDSLIRSGQDIGRAVAAAQTPSERIGTISTAAQGLQLENMSLQNQMIRAQIAKLTQAPQVPVPSDGSSYMIPGQGNSSLVKADPLKTAPAPLDRSHQEGGAITDIGYSRTPTGFAPYPSKDLKERIEDVTPYEWEHFFRNRILPSFGQRLVAPFDPPAGKTWWWNTAAQEYQLLDNGDRPTAGHRVPPRTSITVNPGRR